LSADPSDGGARTAGAATARSEEELAFEREYPGASLLANRAFREIEIVGGLVEGVVASIARRYGLSHAALNALAVIEANAEPMATGEVGARMHITSGTVTSVLDTLERKGLVTRLDDPEDRRRVLVDVTPEAQAVLDSLIPEIQQVAGHVVEHVGEQRVSELLETLDLVKDALATVPDDLPPPSKRRTPARLRRR